MSHTMESEDGRYVVHFNGDWNGDVHMRDRETGEEMVIPAATLLSVVAYGYVLPRRVSQLEEMDWRELLEAP